MNPEQLLKELNRELVELMQLDIGFKPPTQDVVLTHESGQIEVIVNPAGELTKVSISSDWQSKLDVDALAPAILETIAKAQAKGFGLDDGAALTADVEQEVEQTAAIAKDMQFELEQLLAKHREELLAPISQAELQRQVDELPGQFERVLAQAENALTRLEQKAAGFTVQESSAVAVGEEPGTAIYSQNHMVSLRVVSGFVGEVSIKQNWLAARSGIAITECFEQIIEQLPAVVAEQKNDLGAGL